ncbi:MAG: hypothetical protein ABF868_08200 [Sporolactobacillus sp.]
MLNKVISYREHCPKAYVITEICIALIVIGIVPYFILPHTAEAVALEIVIAVIVGSILGALRSPWIKKSDNRTIDIGLFRRLKHSNDRSASNSFLI